MPRSRLRIKSRTRSTSFEAEDFRASLKVSSEFCAKSEIKPSPPRIVDLTITSETPEDLAGRVLKDPHQFRIRTEQMLNYLSTKEIDAIASPEARGFEVGRVIADKMLLPFIPIRKVRYSAFRHQGRTRPTYHNRYYYGETEFSAPEGLDYGQRTCIIDDDFMTGGTFAASMHALDAAHARIVGIAALIQWPQFMVHRYLVGFRGFSFSSLKAINPASPFTNQLFC